MTNPTPGPLAFTAEDFSKGEDAEVGEWISLEWLAKATNRILAEKLAKAPVAVTTLHDNGVWYSGRLKNGHTHTARLVCIEEIATKTPDEK